MGNVRAGGRVRAGAHSRRALADLVTVTAARLTHPPHPLVLSGTSLTSVGRLRMYVCGVTPYEVTHLGHAATFIWADAAERVLRWAGNSVTVARNVTDVDQALYREAARRGVDATMLAALQRASFESTMTDLRVRKPDVSPTVAQGVGHVIQLGAALLAHEAAYVRHGSVYARAARAAEQAGIDRVSALTRSAEYGDVPEDQDKDDPLDVVVWQSTDEGARWPSPWGAGRPGWHASCAAMVLSQFGASVDLHCGGADLVYPHHAVETVMAEAATGVAPFARAWLRAGVVEADGQKMAKSTGNLVLVDDLLRDWSPAVIRLMVLNRPWSQGWSFHPADLEAAASTLDQLYAAAGKPDSSTGSCEALLDNLDVSTALATGLDAGGSCARELIEVLALS